MRRMKKEACRILSALLAAAMILTLMPQGTAVALAAEIMEIDPDGVTQDGKETAGSLSSPEAEEQREGKTEEPEGESDPAQFDEGEGNSEESVLDEGGADLEGQEEAGLYPNEAVGGETDTGEPDTGESGEGGSDEGEPGEVEPGEGEPDPEMVKISFASSDGGDRKYKVTLKDSGEDIADGIPVTKGSSEEISVTVTPTEGYVIRNVQIGAAQPIRLTRKSVNGDIFSLTIVPYNQKNGYTKDAVILVETVERQDVTLKFQFPGTSGMEELKVRQGLSETVVDQSSSTIAISNQYTASVLIKTEEGKIPLLAYDDQVQEYGDIEEGYYAFSLGRTFHDTDIAITLEDACQITFNPVDVATTIGVVSIAEDSYCMDGEYEYIRDLGNNMSMAVKGAPFYFMLSIQEDVLGGVISVETEDGEKLRQYSYEDETVYGCNPETDTKIIIKKNPRAIPLFYAGEAVSEIEVIDDDGIGAAVAEDRKYLMASAAGEVKLRFTVTEGSELSTVAVYYDGEYEGEEDYQEEIGLVQAGDGVYETTENIWITDNINKIVILGNQKADQVVWAGIPKSSISVGEAAVISADAFGELTYSSSDPKVATVSRWGRVTGVSVGEAEITVNAAGDDNVNPGSASFTVKVTPAEGPYVLYGAAEKLQDGSFRLTPNDYDRKGSVWYRERFSTADDLTVTFSYWAGSGDGIADGIVMMLSEETGLGGEGDGVPDEGGGLAFLPGSYGVEFDSYYNEGGDGSDVMDPTEKKHIAIVKDDVNNHVKFVEDERVADGEWHSVSVAYSRADSTLRVQLDGEEVLCGEEISLPDITYVGISAATGDFINEHLIKDFLAYKGKGPDQPEDPDEKPVVTFRYPEGVSLTVDGHTLSDDKVTVETGSSISFQALSEDENYEISSVKANGAEVSVDGSTGKYRLTIDADTEIVITTAKKQTGTEPADPGKVCTVTFTCPEGVSVTADGYTLTDNRITVETGKSISFRPLAGEGYRISSVKVGGTQISPDEGTGKYTLTVDADKEVVITAEKVQTEPEPVETRTVTFTYPEMVAVTVADAVWADKKITVESGKTIFFEVSLTDENYEITSVKADGMDVNREESTGKYSLTISADTEIVITTTKKQTGEDPTEPSDPGVSETGITVVLAVQEGYDAEKGGYVYTGSAVTPEVRVYYNGVKRTAGVDYTVKYANNVNASETAKVTVTGKGDLTGKYEKTFRIIPKEIGDPDVEAGSVRVVKNTKASPVLAYKGRLLAAKDYINPSAGTKFTDNGSITVTGKGNFTGTRVIPVQVVDNKSALNKISIRLDNNANKKLAYDGKEKYPAFQVLDAKKKEIPKTEEGKSYLVVYPSDIVSAGTVKFTVVGIGEYTGSVTKSYKIKPSGAPAGSVTVSNPDSAGYSFRSTGVTQYRPEVSVNGTRLQENRDYTLKYSNNRKAGTAKCKISFLGNYKGTKAVTREFKINPFDMKDFSADNIIVPDQSAGNKPGIYKSTPYIIEEGTNVLLKSSAFKLTYYVKGDPRVSGSGAVEMKGSNGRIQSGTVWVKVEPKNANYTGEPVYVSYEVRAGGSDLSKAKVSFTPNRIPYTGRPITETEVACKVQLNGATVYDSGTMPNDKISVRYVNNISKGKATVIITGNGTDYTGTKKAVFTIAASNIKNK